MTLEALWNKFQDLWISINARDPSTIDHPPSIEKDNRKTQRMRVYQFLTALDERFEAIKKEIINKDPLPNLREMYAMVRREADNERILKPPENKEQPGSGIGAGLITFDRNRASQPPPPSSSRYPGYLRQPQWGRRQKSMGVYPLWRKKTYQRHLFSLSQLSGEVGGDEESLTTESGELWRRKSIGSDSTRGQSRLYRRFGGWHRNPDYRKSRR